MIRPSTLAAIALGFLTALAAGQLGILVLGTTLEQPVYGQVAGVDVAVDGFYAGINGSLAGDDRALESAVTTDFVDHPPAGGADRSAEGLLDYLGAVHQSLPKLRFEVLSFDATGSIVSVDLLGVPGPAPVVVGWTIELPPPLTVREILRIERGKVAERWAADEQWPSELRQVAFEQALGVEAFRQPALQRFTLDAQLSVDVRATGTVMLWLESGELRAGLVGTDELGRARAPTEPLGPGDFRRFDLEGDLPVRTGSEPAVFWMASLDTILIPRPAGLATPDPDAPGLHQDTHVSLAVRFPQTDPHLHLALISLPAGTRLSAETADMTGIAVVEGELTAVSESGFVAFCFDGSRSRMLDGIERAAAGQGFAATRAGAAQYQVTSAGPTLLLLLSIDPGTTIPLPPFRTGPG